MHLIRAKLNEARDIKKVNYIDGTAQQNETARFKRPSA